MIFTGGDREYQEGVYSTFLILRKQFRRCRSQKGLDRYSKIEFLKNKYITFRRFCDECEKHFVHVYRFEPTQESVQNVFDKLLEKL